MKTLRPDEEATFQVDAREFCNSSGIQLEAGKRYALEVTQIDEPWQDAWVKSSPSRGWLAGPLLEQQGTMHRGRSPRQVDLPKGGTP